MSTHDFSPHTTKHALQLPQTSPLVMLPREVQDMVFDNAHAEGLSRLGQTCSALRIATLPALYHKVDIHLDSPQRALFRRTLSESLSTSQQISKLVKALRVKVTKGSARHLYGIVELCSNLSEFTCDWFVDHKPPAVQDYVDETILCAALVPVKDKLVKLTANYQVKYSHVANVLPFVNEPCSLKDMSALKTLEIPFFLLLGWYPRSTPLASVLPRSLVTLTFLEDEWWSGSTEWVSDAIVDILTGFVDKRNWEQITPGLAEINYIRDACRHIPTHGQDYLLEAENRFKELCKENGLRCTVCKFPTRLFQDWR